MLVSAAGASLGRQPLLNASASPYPWAERRLGPLSNLSACSEIPRVLALDPATSIHRPPRPALRRRLFGRRAPRDARSRARPARPARRARTRRQRRAWHPLVRVRPAVAGDPERAPSRPTRPRAGDPAAVRAGARRVVPRRGDGPARLRMVARLAVRRRRRGAPDGPGRDGLLPRLPPLRAHLVRAVGVRPARRRGASNRAATAPDRAGGVARDQPAATGVRSGIGSGIGEPSRWRFGSTSRPKTSMNSVWFRPTLWR